MLSGASWNGYARAVLAGVAISGVAAGDASAQGWSATVVREVEPERAPAPATVKPGQAAHFEVWTGGEAAPGSLAGASSSSYWSIWSGITWAPFGSVRDTGWRLRAAGGGGRYTYSGALLVNNWPTPTDFQGTSLFAEALAGYQAQIGIWTLKPFVGVAYQAQRITPTDPFNPLAGARTGAKAVLENWFAITPAVWASVDGSWTSIYNGVWSRGRLGVRVLRDYVPDLSIGPEISAFADQSRDARWEPRLTTINAGVFVRYAWERGEITVSGGVSDDHVTALKGYAGGNLLTRF